MVPGRAQLVFQLSYSVGSKTSPSLPSQVFSPRSLQSVACRAREKHDVPQSPRVLAGDITCLKCFEVPWSITDSCRASHAIPCPDPTQHLNPEPPLKHP